MEAKKKKSKDYTIEGMSANELKYRLFERFREIGVLDGLEVQLRSKLVSEVFKASSPAKKSKEANPVDSQAPLLPLQVCNWLVANHLKRSGFEYSLSTFISESQLPNPEKLFSICDILHILKYGENSMEYDVLQSDYMRNKESFLTIYLNFIVNLKKTGPGISKSDQFLPGNRNEPELFHPSKVFQDIFSKRNSNVHLPSMEPSAIHILQVQREKHEEEILHLRKKLIQEIDMLHEQELRAKFNIEEMKNKLMVEAQKLENEKTLIKQQELEFQQKVELFDQRMQMKERALQDEIMSEQKMKAMESWEIKLKRQQNWLEDELSNLKKTGQESENLQLQIGQLEKSHKSLQDDYACVLYENESLRNKLKDVADYSVVKEELTVKTKRLESCEIQMAQLKFDMQEEKMASLDTIRKLQQQLILQVPQPKVPAPPERNFHYDPTYSRSFIDDTQNPRAFTEFGRTVMQKIAEQKDDITELHRLVHGLYNKLTPSRNTTIEQHAETDRQPVSVSLRGLLPMQDYNVGSKTIPTFPLFHNKYIEKPLQFITEAKKKIDSLEKETDALEEKYKKMLASDSLWSPTVNVADKVDLDANFISCITAEPFSSELEDAYRFKIDALQRLTPMCFGETNDNHRQNEYDYQIPDLKELDNPTLKEKWIKDFDLSKKLDFQSFLPSFNSPYLNTEHQSTMESKDLVVESSVPPTKVPENLPTLSQSYYPISNPCLKSYQIESGDGPAMRESPSGNQKEQDVVDITMVISKPTRDHMPPTESVMDANSAQNLPMLGQVHDSISNPWLKSHRVESTDVTTHESPSGNQKEQDSVDIAEVIPKPTQDHVPQTESVVHNNPEQSLIGSIPCSQSLNQPEDAPRDSVGMVPPPPGEFGDVNKTPVEPRQPQALLKTISPLRRKRGLFSMPLQGVPVVDLDSAWQRRKSIEQSTEEASPQPIEHATFASKQESASVPDGQDVSDKTSHANEHMSTVTASGSNEAIDTLITASVKEVLPSTDLLPLTGLKDMLELEHRGSDDVDPHLALVPIVSSSGTGEKTDSDVAEDYEDRVNSEVSELSELDLSVGSSQKLSLNEGEDEW